MVIDANQDLLAGGNKINNILKGALTGAVPKHQSAVAFLLHADILTPAIRIRAGRLGCRNTNLREIADIIPRCLSGKVYGYFWIVCGGKKMLNGAVSPVAVADKDIGFKVNETLQLGSSGGRQITNGF